MGNRVENLQALLLCGGKGERLRPLTNTLPKPMIPIKGKPILSYLVNHLARYGIRDLVIATGYQSDVIRRYFESHHRELKITLVDSGDADILTRIQSCRAHLNRDFLVCYGDTLADVDLDKLWRFHQTHRGKVTVTGYPLKSQFGLMEISPEGEVSDFAEKPTLNQWINIGYCCFDDISVKQLDGYARFVDFLSEQSKKGLFFGFKHDGLHITVNTVQELNDAEQNISSFEEALEPLMAEGSRA